MLSQAQRTTILELNAQQVSKREIARVLGISRVAVRKVLRANSTSVPELQRPEKAEPYRQQILELFDTCQGNLVRVHEELVAAGAELSYAALTAFCRRHGIGYAPPAPAGRYEFAPGEELQHDTSPHELELGGRKRKVQTASAVLCYSRMLFFQCYPTFRRFDCKVFLTDALRYWGGATTRVMIDNTHVVVLRGSGRDMVPVPEMAAFGERFGFEFVAHAIGNANRSAQQHQRQMMVEAIGQADSELIRSADAEELARQFADEFALEAPTLTEAALSITVDETEVDVTGDFRFGAWGPGPHNVPGIRVTYYVPYSGDRQMFDITPSTRNLSMRPVDLGDGVLQFAYERPDQDVMATKAEVDREIQQVKESLNWLRNDFQTFNATLLAAARESIEARKSRLAQMSRGAQSIGIPIRKPAAAANGPVRETVQRGTEVPTRRAAEHYDIALSFAGENRAYVEEVANGLKAAGISVFYDGFETAKLWGKNLIEHLATVYQNSRYVVMFVSKEYVEKAWTTHERQHAQDRALYAQEEYILPARFDDTPVPGMTSTVAFQDLRHTTPQQLVDLIRTKLEPR